MLLLLSYVKGLVGKIAKAVIYLGINYAFLQFLDAMSYAFIVFLSIDGPLYSGVIRIPYFEEVSTSHCEWAPIFNQWVFLFYSLEEVSTF